jgi:phosphoribosylformimino-5-aminoimidazole carboxamide ribotide isomerase
MSIASFAAMRVVGVIDLKDGAAVHAVRGERERYRPVHSVLAGEDGDPLALARGYRSIGLEEIYVADLDAITGAGSNRDAIRALANEARLMVDAGVTEPERARELGDVRVIVGTETLSGPLDPLLAVGNVVLSIDLRDGRVLSPDPRLAGLTAPEALERLHDPRLRDVIVLDLARVGSGAGFDVDLIAELHAAHPELQLLAGGGVRDAEDLRALAAAGAAGALVATALHRGVIGARELR